MEVKNQNGINNKRCCNYGRVILPSSYPRPNRNRDYREHDNHKLERFCGYDVQNFAADSMGDRSRYCIRAKIQERLIIRGVENVFKSSRCYYHGS